MRAVAPEAGSGPARVAISVAFRRDLEVCLLRIQVWLERRSLQGITGWDGGGEEKTWLCVGRKDRKGSV